MSMLFFQVMPVVIQCLPMKEDFEENATVFKCMVELYKMNQPDTMKQIPDIMMAAAHVLGTDQIQEGEDSCTK